MNGPGPDELARLQREVGRLQGALDEARAREVREAQRRQVLVRANNLLDRELFRARLTRAVLEAAEAGTDLDGFCTALFELIARVVRVRSLGLRTLEPDGGNWSHPGGANADGEAILDLMIEGGKPPDRDHVFVHTFVSRGQTLGHLVCLSDGLAFAPGEREIMADICRQAQPILERNLLIRKLEELAGFQEDFAQMLGHDLRAPLTGVIAALSMLEMPGAKLDADQRAQLARTALNSARLANELIGDLLDVAKLEAGKGHIEREPLDLLAIAGSCLEHQRPVATTKGLQLVLEAPHELPLVSGDAGKLQRVFANLVGNALKYSTEGGVLVRLGTQDGEVVACVADTGLGVPLDAQPRLFEKFFQVAGRPRAGGAGLGLTFCKQVIEAHGGRIWVESPSRLAAETLGLEGGNGKHPGSAFYFALPS